jgi:dynein heavy chain
LSFVTNSVCENILAVYLDDSEETPWDALRYLIAQCNYGGRVTDNLDRRLLQVYINQYFTEQALTVPKFALSSSEIYFIPDDGNLESYRRHIATLPKADQDPPEAFGQHANADIASQMDETKTLLGTILSLQPRIVVTGGKSREKQVLELIIQLLEQVPLEFDIKAVQRRHEMDKSPLTTVLLQEISRYNELLSEVTQSLHDLRRSITGEVVISPELELMFECLFTAQVPPSWQSAYPSVMPLAFWIRDLGARVSQLRRWADDEPPKVFWLSGFTFPVGFLTALLQTSARRNGVSIDTLSWDFVVMTHNEASINMKPKEGAYIKGLYLEGARWDPEGCLAEPYAMELYSDMPIIHFKPVTHRKSGSKGLHATPLYTFPVRGGTRDGRSSFMMEVDLKHGAGPHDSQFWTKRGVALLLALDH